MSLLSIIGEFVVVVLPVLQEARRVAWSSPAVPVPAVTIRGAGMIPDDGMILGVEMNPGVATTHDVAVAVLVPVQALFLSAQATMLLAALVVACAVAIGPGMGESRCAMADLLAADENLQLESLFERVSCMR